MTPVRSFCRSIVVEPTASRLCEIRRFVESVAADLTLDAERTFDLKVAVSEACANAVGLELQSRALERRPLIREPAGDPDL